MRAKDSIAHIDRYYLERDWERQADLVKEWGDNKADAEYRVNVLESKLKFVAAQLSDAIRKHPERFGLKGVTEPLVASTILLQRPYRRTQRRLNKAKHVLDLCKGALKALDHKKDSMENLQKGDMQSFFSTPRVKRDIPIGVSYHKRRKRKGHHVKKGS